MGAWGSFRLVAAAVPTPSFRRKPRHPGESRDPRTRGLGGSPPGPGFRRDDDATTSASHGLHPRQRAHRTRPGSLPDGGRELSRLRRPGRLADHLASCRASTSRPPRSATSCRIWRSSACSPIPHTSAGRVPTESGLRLFVDGMMQAAEPSARGARGDRGAARAGRADRGGAVRDATAALSGLSACAGIVLVPEARAGASPARLRPVVADPGAGGDGRRRGQRREPGRRPSGRDHRLGARPRSAITSAPGSPA